MPEDIEMESAAPDDEVAGTGSHSTQMGSRTPRLFIKEMVMRDFKSYAGEQRVGPFHKVRVALLHSFAVFSLSFFIFFP